MLEALTVLELLGAFTAPWPRSLTHVAASERSSLESRGDRCNLVAGGDRGRRGGRPCDSRSPRRVWATSQAKLIDQRLVSDARGLAETVLEFGGDPGPLPLADSFDGLLNRAQLVEWANSRQRVIVIDLDDQLSTAREYQWIPSDPAVSLGNDVLDVPMRWSNTERDVGLRGRERRSLRQAVRKALATAWAAEPDEIQVEDVERYDIVQVQDADDVELRAEEWLRPNQLGFDGDERQA